MLRRVRPRVVPGSSQVPPRFPRFRGGRSAAGAASLYNLRLLPKASGKGTGAWPAPGLFCLDSRIWIDLVRLDSWFWFRCCWIKFWKLIWFSWIWFDLNLKCIGAGYMWRWTRRVRWCDSGTLKTTWAASPEHSRYFVLDGQQAGWATRSLCCCLSAGFFGGVKSIESDRQIGFASKVETKNNHDREWQVATFSLFDSEFELSFSQSSPSIRIFFSVHVAKQWPCSVLGHPKVIVHLDFPTAMDSFYVLVLVQV